MLEKQAGGSEEQIGSRCNNEVRGEEGLSWGSCSKFGKEAAESHLGEG